MRPIHKIKVQYYSKEVLKYLFVAGIITIAASSPYFSMRVIKAVSRKNTAVKRQKAKNALAYLRRKRLVEIRKSGHDIEVRLTKEGRKHAGKYQIDDLSIPRPKKWDGKWRFVIFDIPKASDFVRDVFRRKLKEFGFCALQKSIWVYPFPCQEEISLLREFLGADKKQIQLLEVSKAESDTFLREAFHL